MLISPKIFLLSGFSNNYTGNRQNKSNSFSHNSGLALNLSDQFIAGNKIKCYNNYNNCDSVSFTGKINQMQEKDKEMQMLADILSEYDFDRIADNLINYDSSSTGNILIEIQKQDDGNSNIHIAVPDTNSEDECTHFLYSKDDFSNLIEHLEKATEEKYPICLSSFKESASRLKEKLQSIQVIPNEQKL